MISKNKAKPETGEGSFEPSVAPRVVTSDANYYHYYKQLLPTISITISKVITSDANYYHLAAWKVPEDLKDLAHKD